MKIFSSRLTILLKKDVAYQDMFDFISQNLNKAFLMDNDLKNLHSKNIYKPYCFSNLYPFDIREKIYKQNNVYVFELRSIDKDVFDKISTCLQNSKNLDFQVLAIEKSQQELEFLDSVITKTPAILTLPNEKGEKTKYWTSSNSNIQYFIESIKNNLEKKYFQFFGEKIIAPDDFITYIEIKNEKPICFNYKKTTLFSNKFKIVFNTDQVSQKLAKLAFGVGLLEKNSLGFGFLIRSNR